MTLHFLSKSEKQRLLAELEEIYGITKLNYLLLETGKKKVRAFSGNLTKEQISQLSELTNVEIVGMYMINKKDSQARINFDAISLPEIKSQISKNILKINEKQLALWLRGSNLSFSTDRGTVVLKYEDDFVGVGKSNTETIFNYVPKERKLRN